MRVCSPLWFPRAGAKLAVTVSKPGKGRTLKPAAKKMKTVQPTTLDMGAFGRLQSVPAEERTVHKNTLEKVSTFSELRIVPSLRENVRKNLFDCKDTPPTAIQKVAIKALRKVRKDPFALKTWLLAAETGSGKTLAYLLPLLSDLTETERPTSAPFVRSMVFVPTLELVSQVEATVRALVPPTFKVSTSPSQAAAKGVDMLICSPSALKPLLKTSGGQKSLPHCRAIVVDEADTLFDKSFSHDTLQAIQACPQLIDVVLCSATIPRYFEKIIRHEFPTATRLVTPSIHRLPRHIDFRVIEVFRKPYNDSKTLALQQALYAIFHDNTEPSLTKRVVVFVNNKRDVLPLTKMLIDAGYAAEHIDGSLDGTERKQALSAFVNPPQDLAMDAQAQDKLKILVATDIAARGVDMHRVRNVILYDLPRSAADLLHRAGRTGRLGAKGRVLLFISKKESHGWVRGLQTIVRKGYALA